MPARLLEIDLSGASTWQFFERDGIVLLRDQGRTATLSVRSAGPGGRAPHEDSHFAVSMFQIGDDDDDERRLPALEASLQPLLDWLAGNHHDFIRLRDFSESLSLLRFLRQHQVAPILLDLDGEDPEIATPDRTIIGEGPLLK